MKTKQEKKIAVAAIIFVIALANISFPGLRFSSWFANDVAFILILTIPLIIFFLSFSLQNKQMKIAIICCSLPVAGICLISQFFLFLHVSISKNGEDATFSPVAKIFVNGSNVVTYESDLGATTKAYIVVRQEREIVSGLLLVRELYNEEIYQFGRLEVAGSATVRIDDLTIPVRRFVWF